VPKYRYGEIEENDQIGVVTGLAWTDVRRRAAHHRGRHDARQGRMTVTGNLADVMKESISAAASYARSRAIAFGIEPPLFDKRDIHVHVPEGPRREGWAVGRRRNGDGDRFGDDRHPGAPRCRHDRRDHVARPRAADRRLKEKLLAAHRAASRRWIIQEENAKDLVEISDQIKGGLDIIPGVAHG